tara:strand:+ start:534 stop:2708 length:2175 start_codon:yes stop_codon:yes gene_type:complete
MPKELSDKKFIEETSEIWRTYSNNRETWAQQAQEDKEFRLGRQWTTKQKETLEGRGQAAIVINRIHPAVESAKAMITANKPSFRVSPREDSDNKTAQAINGLLEYVWQISDGDQVLRNVVDDYYVLGMGAMQVYIDPMMDMGKGEICLHDIDPLDIYIDPNSRDRFCDDAENIIVSRLFTRDQAESLYPMYANAIKNASTDAQQSDRPATDRADDIGLIFPETSGTETRATLGKNDEYVRGYERYSKIVVNMHRVKLDWSGEEDLIDDANWPEFLEKQYWVINGQILEREEQAKLVADAIIKQYAAKEQTAKQKGELPPEPPKLENVTSYDLIKMGRIEEVVVPTKRIKMCVIMGDKLLYKRLLPIDKYPIVFFMNQHTRTPYPVSDVRMVKGLQEYINKTRSLIIAHATTSTNTKILIPSGSIDMREFEEKWAQPGVAIECDFDQGQPVPVQPSPLPNELYSNETTAKSDIDHQLGLYEMMMGNSQVAPNTYKATISLDEFGQRKMKSKLMDIEVGLKRIGEIAIPMMQQLYKEEKVVRLLRPNNSTSKFAINKKLYDDKGELANVVHRLDVGKYDVIVVTGSTLPTNRYAQLEMYMDAYEKGIIDKLEVLKKTEVFDMEGVLERTDVIQQLQGQLQTAQESIKKLQGDLQTREREAFHAKQRAEIEKFKADLDSTSTKAKAAGTVFEKRLDDAMGQIKREVREASLKESKKIKNGSPSKKPE